MTIHHDYTTDAEDVAFDATLKVIGAVFGLLVIAGMASWYIFS